MKRPAPRCFRAWRSWIMLRSAGVFLLLLTINYCQAQEKIDPALAVVRIHSHGASGCVIASTKGKSLILSCAHMFRPPDALKRRLRIDGPLQPNAPVHRVAPKLLAVDFHLDLSLLELPNGPFFHVPVAPRGFKNSTMLWSIGYDEMNWPVTKLSTKFLHTTPTTTFTKERPRHGRSGGGLFDSKMNYLVGIVQGYEITGAQRGLYVSHQAILRFLGRFQQGPPPAPAPPMQQYGGVQPLRLSPHSPFCPPGKL